MDTALLIVVAVLQAVSIVLHVVAPLTATTKDDKAAEYIDDALALIPKKSDAKTS